MFVIQSAVGMCCMRKLWESVDDSVSWWRLWNSCVVDSISQSQADLDGEIVDLTSQEESKSGVAIIDHNHIAIMLVHPELQDSLTNSCQLCPTQRLVIYWTRCQRGRP
jgi:hypothetical protein